MATLLIIKICSKRNIKITGVNIDKVASFKIFKEEYKKVKGPNMK